MEENNKKVIEMFPDKTRVEELKRKANVIRDIAIRRALMQMEDPKTFTIAGSIGLWQGLKYRGNLKLGVQSGLAALGVMVGVNVLNGIVADMDDIKDA